jgi:hypothetical protein
MAITHPDVHRATFYPDFDPPASDLPGKPQVPPWVPPPITTETHNFAKLQSIDLSKMKSSDPSVQAALVRQVKEAIRDDGFLFLENYGVSLEQVSQLQVECRS